MKINELHGQLEKSEKNTTGYKPPPKKEEEEKKPKSQRLLECLRDKQQN